MKRPEFHPGADAPRWPLWLYAGTIFSSAFLLFLVQPLMAKQILPWFGGSAGVWSVCMVFFQVLLLAGYAYADLITRRLTVTAQARLHVTLLLLSLAFLPIVATTAWKPSATEEPSLWILGLLFTTIGLPYFLLSTTGPLLQSWLTRTAWGQRVYRYFALSNLASLISLLCYPVLIEPTTALLVQAKAWSWGYAAFVVLCAATAWHAARGGDQGPIRGPAEAPGLRAAASTVTAAAPLTRWLWLALPGLASWLLLATTNHITQNIAAMPFLWIAPLVVYLLSFVLTFESDRWYRRRLFVPLGAVTLLVSAYGLQASLGVGVITEIPIYIGGLFVWCMVLHGEAARLRPGAAQLTRFYLMLSTGGALGGIAVGLVAPQVLPAYYELGLGFVLTAALAVVVFRTQRRVAAAAGAVALACGVFLASQVIDDHRGALRVERNFYGTLLTVDARRDNPQDDVRQLYHGSVKHGEQYLSAVRKREATTYYGATAGVGRAWAGLTPGERRVGVIGLGAGVLASYGRVGDVLRMYEINPAVIQVAQTDFSFMRDSAARVETVLGDARLVLEREPPQRFDMLVIDAFSGDSIPIHLVTTEAMTVYLRHLEPEGILAFHITNRYIALASVVDAIARAQGLHAVLVHDPAKDSPLRATDWVLVAREARILQRPQISEAATPIAPVAGHRAWSDDFNHLFSVLK